MLNAFGYLSCFKLCWHNRPGPIHWYDNPIQLRIADLYHIVYSFKRACVDVNSEPVEEQWNCIDCKDKVYNEMDKDM